MILGNNLNILIIMYLCVRSVPLPEDTLHGCQHQAAAPPGGLQHALVPVLLAHQPSPRLLLARDVQQHHPVPV